MRVFGFIVITIYFMALLSRFDNFYYHKYISYPEEQGHWYCAFFTGGKLQALALLTKDILLISILPLPILIFLQIALYRAIVHSSQQFQLDANRIRTMKRVRKTFCTVILAFFVLTVPAGTYFVVINGIIYYTSYVTKYTLELSRFFNILLTLNSCVNPLIYSKIHRRCSLCRWMRRQSTQGLCRWIRRQSTHGSHTADTDQASVIELQNISGENAP